MDRYSRLLLWVILGIAIAQFGFGVNPAIAKIPEHYTELEFPPLPEVTIPDYQRYELDNGMVVYLMEDHSLPLISGTALVKVGTRFDPPQQVGLAELMGMTWRTGGTEKYTAESLNLLLENQGAAIESDITVASGKMSFNALSEDIGEIIPIFAEILRYPRFDEQQIAIGKTNIEGSIARRNDNPNEIATREFNKLIYGDNSPYGRTVEYETIEPLTREDVIKFYHRYVKPESIILGIVGDFDTEEIKQLIKENFADWEVKQPETTPPISITEQPSKNGLYLAEQPQLSQSNILLGHIGGEFSDPDYPALSVLNGLLNGFGGRLFQELRSRQGLAYSVYGVWSPRYDYPGLFIAGGQTRSQATVAFIESLLAEIERVRTTPLTPEELDYAKNSILNSFVFEFEQPSQTLSRLMSYEYYGYPEDFIFQYQQGVEKTTPEDILRVAQTHLKPENIVILVVGNPAEIQPPLSDLNPDIQIVDVSANS